MIEQREIRSERGMVTSEYAVATIGACGLACVLIALSPEFDDFLRSIFERGLGPIITRLL
jgi:hypothetical protein